MLYPEFGQYKSQLNNINPLVNCYLGDNGIPFYVEPGFHAQLMVYKERKPEAYEDLLKEIANIIKKKERVVFTGDYEDSALELESYIYLEVEDIANGIGVIFRDDNRPSDYGD